MNDIVSYIYKIINDVDNIVYIDQTTKPYVKWCQDQRNYKTSNSKLHVHMTLIGSSHFHIIVYT